MCRSGGVTSQSTSQFEVLHGRHACKSLKTLVGSTGLEPVASCL